MKRLNAKKGHRESSKYKKNYPTKSFWIHFGLTWLKFHKRQIKHVKDDIWDWNIMIIILLLLTSIHICSVTSSRVYCKKYFFGKMGRPYSSRNWTFFLVMFCFAQCL